MLLKKDQEWTALHGIGNFFLQGKSRLTRMGVRLIMEAWLVMMAGRILLPHRICSASHSGVMGNSKGPQACQGEKLENCHHQN